MLTNYFNSIKVRLEPERISSTDKSLFYFNSIKVRLELHLKDHHRMPVPFQFHKGTIRTVQSLNPEAYGVYFNSIKVRLEHSNSCVIVIKQMLFQFHKGTIRT